MDIITVHGSPLVIGSEYDLHLAKTFCLLTRPFSSENSMVHALQIFGACIAMDTAAAQCEPPTVRILSLCL